jgi:hypothetical protein
METIMIKPSDTLLVKIPHVAKQSEIDQIRTTIRDMLGHETKIIIVCNGVEISVITTDEGEKA